MSPGCPCPSAYFGHGFFLSQGGEDVEVACNVVDPFDLAETFGTDAVRYFCLREAPFGGDGNYDHNAIINRINADLANDLGNLAQRSLSMVAKNCDAAVPEPGELAEADRAMLAKPTPWRTRRGA